MATSCAKSNNGQSGAGVFVNKKLKDDITRCDFREFQSSRNIPTHNRQIPTEDRSIYAPTTSHSDEEIDNLNNNTDMILEKQSLKKYCDGGLQCEC